MCGYQANLERQRDRQIEGAKTRVGDRHLVSRDKTRGFRNVFTLPKPDGFRKAHAFHTRRF